MKKLLLCLLGFIWSFGPVLVKAQSFTVTSDTVTANVTNSATVYNNITNTTSSGLVIRWYVIATSFPADWLTPIAFGVCDKDLCRANSGDTFLWRTATGMPGNTITTSAYTPGVAETFDLSLNLTGASLGSHWVTIKLAAGISESKNITFVINKVPAGVTNVNSNENEILLYPNPAHDELNVVYSANADIKNIAVYNIIGKLMTVYKVSGASANLNLENIPSGIYFVRLTNSRGDVVVTRKFTKQ